MEKLTLKADPLVANAFLEALEPIGKFSFQTFPEGPNAGKFQHPKVLHGQFHDVVSELAILNNTGHGIFVMINKGDLRGRSAKNVTQVRAHFVDLDGAPIDPIHETDLAPHIIVRSSPGRWHAYWCVDDCPLDQFKFRQQALAARFNADKTVCDLSRVMRLPGFWHLKSGTPFQTELLKPAAIGKAQ